MKTKKLTKHLLIRLGWLRQAAKTSKSYNEHWNMQNEIKLVESLLVSLGVITEEHRMK